MRYSLSTKISVVFVIVFVLVCLLFATFGKIQLSSALDRMKLSQANSINYLLALYDRGMTPQDTKQYFSNFNMYIVEDRNLASNVLSSGQILLSRSTPLGELTSLQYQNGLYLHINSTNVNALLESSGTKNINDPLWIGFFITLALLASLYFSVMKSLLPLKKLNNNIKKFATGNLETATLNVEGDDEIAEVAREFDKAVIKIKELVRSRQLFLRTIMHELKTPIGKGRIVSEMVEDETQRKRLVNIFERLEILINEFAKTEQLLSKSYTINFEEYHFSLLVEQARDMLMLDEWDEHVSIEYLDDVILTVDFQMFTLAIKNLIDNALKYSSDKKVNIICSKEQIVVSNRGKPLPINIDHYKQAFVRSKDEKTTGMGLGLYIIDRICQMHKFYLDYYYSEEHHHFCIIFNKVSATSCELPTSKKGLFKKR
ncbi:MAG: HAMP domain-containing histidine kinase [Campylobacter sp.]|nr:HAMP domain-containing histidine kinase [Campylobacter sp.]